MTTPRRKLIDKNIVAEKLDISTATFDRKRNNLESIGFPPPVLNTDLFGSYKWDERAIDLWLDQKMPAHLLSPEIQSAPYSTASMEQDLADRAANLVF